MTAPQLSGTVGGRYEIAGPVAAGGMGAVYRARDLVLHRTVALKVLKTTDDPSFLERFRAEARNAASLSHPGIVQVFDFGEDNGMPFIAMEFVDGATLRSMLAARGRITPLEAVRLAAQVAEALDHAHRNGLIHRDIKPENILVNSEGRARVADFGLARAFADARVTQGNMIHGTAHYLAPEQVTGNEADHRADIYALGIMLFEMVAGRVPFTGESAVVIAYRRVGEDVPDVRTIAPEVPPTLAAIIARATARDVEARYPTAAYMAESLRALAADLRDSPAAGGMATDEIPLDGMPTVVIDRTPPQPREPRPVKTQPRIPRRTKLVATAIVVALMTLFAFTFGPLASAVVPEVVGQNEGDARRTLRARGFTIDSETRHHGTIPEGHVISQQPGPGVRGRTSTPVKLFISLGPLLITLQDVRGESIEAAEETLKDDGFTVITKVDAFHPTADVGTVLTMDPAPGELTASGTEITLTVSKGPDITDVPDVTGDPQASAVADLKGAGFVVSVSRAQHDKVAEGLVISQTPKGKARAAKGSTVKIVVSTGPPLVTTPDLLCMTKKQAEEAARAAGVEVKFDRDKRRVVDQEPAPGTKVRKGSTVQAFMGSGFVCDNGD